jgi:hypothetical protein
MRRMPYFGEGCEIVGGIDDVDSGLCKYLEGINTRLGLILESHDFRLTKVSFSIFDDDNGGGVYYKSYAEAYYDKILETGAKVRLVTGGHRCFRGDVGEIRIWAYKSDEGGRFVDPPNWHNNGNGLIIGTRKSVGSYIEKPEEIRKLIEGMRGLGIDRQTWGISESGQLAMDASTAARFCCGLLIPEALQAMQTSGCLDGFDPDDYHVQIHLREFELSKTQSDNGYSQNYSMCDQQPSEYGPVYSNHLSQQSDSAANADDDLDSLARDWGYRNWEHFDDSLPG